MRPPHRAPRRPPRRWSPSPRRPGDFYLHVYPSPVLGTGAGANKPWLQELADPVTKIAWQSWVEVHPTVAERLDLQHGDLLTVTSATGSITAPVYIYLGVHPQTVAIALGRGHTAYGRYAENIGINPLDLLGSVEDLGSGAIALTSTRVQIAKVGDHVQLVSTEGSARQHGRGIAQAMLASELRGGVTPVPGGEGATSANTTPPQGAGFGSGNLGEGVQPGGERVPTAPVVPGAAGAGEAATAAQRRRSG